MASLGECMSSTGLLISLAVGLVIGLIIVWPVRHDIWKFIRHDIWKLIKSKKFIFWSVGLPSILGLITYFELWETLGWVAIFLLGFWIISMLPERVLTWLGIIALFSECA